MKKRTVLLAALVLVFGLVLTGCSSTSDKQSKNQNTATSQNENSATNSKVTKVDGVSAWDIFKDDHGLFAIEYPQSWSVATEENEVKGSIVVEFTKNDYLGEEEDGYAKLSIGYADSGDVFAFGLEQFSDLEEQEIIIDGEESTLRIYTDSAISPHQQAMLIDSFEDSTDLKDMQIIYFFQDDEEIDYQGVFDHMIDSFKFFPQ